jgi:chemotaxis signal transduction protein
MSARQQDLGRSIREDGIVCCTVGDEQYALRSGDVRHIARADELQREAGPRGRVGTLRVGDDAVPVFALGRVLERPTAGPGHHIAVTGDRGSLAGWLVDRIVRMALPDSTSVVALPAVLGATAAHWFEALIAIDDDSVLLLSPALLNQGAGGFARAGAETSVFAAPAGPAGPAPEPLVVIFSTPALPAAAREHAISRYALSARQIAAITQPLPIVTIPGSARHVVGVSWWRQAIVPVIDFRNGTGEYAACSRWLVVQGGHRPAENLMALPIDADVRLHRASSDDRPVPGFPHPPFARGVFGVTNEPVALLDLGALLAVPPSVDALA